MIDKLNPYVTAVDELLRATTSTLSLILCKSTDKTVVEWLEKDINKPLGVSTCQLEQMVAWTLWELEQRRRGRENRLRKTVVSLQTKKD